MLNKDMENRLPLRMGYFLAELGITCSDFPNRPYRGIERLPALDNFEGEHALHRAGQSSIWQLWESYWAADDSRDLATDLVVAQNLCARFNSNGIKLEVIYGELNNVPLLPAARSLLETRRRLEEVFAKYEPVNRKLVNRPPNLKFYGFDLSDPLPTFHSIIRQPGFRALADGLSQRTNKYGLIDDSDAARDLLGSANEVPARRLICVIGVWGIGE